MADGQVVEHLCEQVIQISAMPDDIQIRLVEFFRRFQVEAVQVRIVKEIALAAPDFLVHLLPLGLRIDAHFHLAGLQHIRPAGRSRRHWRAERRRRRDHPVRPLAIENFFAVGRNREGADAFDGFIELALVEVILMNDERRRPE